MGGMRKRVAGISLASVACTAGVVAAVGTAGASGIKAPASNFEGQTVTTAQTVSGPQPSCYFTNDSGAAVSSVTIPTRGGSDQMYWMQYLSNGRISKQVTFNLKPPAGSNQGPIVEKFNTGKSDTNVTAPVGITFWGNGSTSGTWTLTATTNGGYKAICSISAS
jgi:hypothetical protein